SSTPVTEPLVIEAPKITEDTPADDVAATDVSANKVVAEPEASPPTVVEQSAVPEPKPVIDEAVEDAPNPDVITCTIC
ncbi:MAG: hypothetical protein AAF217_08575, partial [Pseudomonadota bacterium]